MQRNAIYDFSLFVRCDQALADDLKFGKVDGELLFHLQCIVSRFEARNVWTDVLLFLTSHTRKTIAERLFRLIFSCRGNFPPCLFHHGSANNRITDNELFPWKPVASFSLVSQYYIRFAYVESSNNIKTSLPLIELFAKSV